MPFLAGTAIGTVIEGTLSLKDGVVVFVEDEDSKAIPVAEITERWLGKKVRLIINDLEVLEQLVEAGMTPGNEQGFIGSLSDDQVDAIIGETE